MDVSNELLGPIGQMGLVGSMMATAIIYFYRRDVRNETRNELREKQIQDKCDEERGDLAGRIRQLEDRQHTMHESTLALVSEALQSNTRALERFCNDHGSGFHKTIGDKS